MAERIGDNILTDHFYRGFFVPSHKHTYVKFDTIEALVLLQLDEALNAKPSQLPRVWPSRPSFRSSYRLKEGPIDNRVIYALTESSEPPKSLQEAAATPAAPATTGQARDTAPPPAAQAPAPAPAARRKQESKRRSSPEILRRLNRAQEQRAVTVPRQQQRDPLQDYGY